MKHDIDITVLNNATGIPPTSDGIMGLFFMGVAVANKFVLNTPYLLTSLDDLAALGIDAAYDTANNVAAYQQISEFYNQAGDGALLWIWGVPTNTAYATYVASMLFDQMIRYTAQADPLNRVKMVGFCYKVPTVTQAAADFPVDVTDTLIALETKRVALFHAGYQFSCIVDGYNMSSAVTPSTIISMATRTSPGVSLCPTGTKPNGVSAVGLALGRFARISLGHGFGAVKDGAVDTNTAFLTNSVSVPVTGVLIVGHIYTVFGGAITYNGNLLPVGTVFICVVGFTVFTTAASGYVVDNSTPVNGLIGTPALGLSPTDIQQLGLKQYMFLRTWFGKSGFYWNDGATCCASNLALSSQEYNRVANALSADALAFFIEEMGQNMPLNVKTGAVDDTWLNAKTAEFYDTYINPLTTRGGSGDISDATLVVTGPNFNATKTLLFELTIVASVILGAVSGTLKFAAKL